MENNIEDVCKLCLWGKSSGCEYSANKWCTKENGYHERTTQEQMDNAMEWFYKKVYSKAAVDNSECVTDCCSYPVEGQEDELVLCTVCKEWATVVVTE